MGLIIAPYGSKKSKYLPSHSTMLWLFCMSIVNPFMTSNAERHQIPLVMCSTITEWLDMMHKCREDVSAPRFTLLTQRMCYQMAVTHASPCAAVPLVLIVATSKAVIMPLHRFLVNVAVAALPVCKVRTARHATWALRLSRHRTPPFRHEKTSAWIAPIGGRAFKHTFHNTILPCQHRNSREL